MTWERKRKFVRKIGDNEIKFILVIALLRFEALIRTKP